LEGYGYMNRHRHTGVYYVLEKEERKMGINVEQNTIHMNMARNVYEYGREGKCVCLFRYTYAVIRIINMQIESEHKTRSAHNTGRKTGREESIHTRHRLIETGKQTRNVREGDRDYYW